MKRMALLMTLLSLGFISCKAQDISGDWNGVLDAMGAKLPIVFHVKNEEGALTATMDSPDQHAFGIPTSKITFNDPYFHLEAANGAIVYDGKLMNNDSIKGEFKQSGMRFPLVLKRGSVKEKALNRPQEPKPPFPYKSEEVSFTNLQQDIQLAGTLTLPDSGKDFPAVILISGSGPQDRNETILGHKPFWVIADYLTRKGIAVLRYDDRGTAKSQGDFNTATTADFATDVEAAVQFLKTRKEINPKKIGLIGHSEGGIIAPMVASRDKSIDFIVLLAGPGVDGADLLVMQNRALGKASGMSKEELAKAEKENKRIYRIVLKGGDKAAMKDTLMAIAAQSGQRNNEAAKKNAAAQIAQLTTPWMRYFLKNNPADYLKKVKCPVLALDGTKDLQVPAEQNIEAIKKALKEGGNQKVTTKIFPGLNHLFQDAQTGLPQEYGNIEETFSPTALHYMADWIEKEVK